MTFLARFSTHPACRTADPQAGCSRLALAAGASANRIDIQLARMSELTSDELASWRCIHQEEPAFANPFFHPEFTRRVAEVWDDVEVAVLVEGGCPAVFFPFHREQRLMAHPVGRGLSDYHGVVVRAGVSRTVELLMNAPASRADRGMYT